MYRSGIAAPKVEERYLRVTQVQRLWNRASPQSYREWHLHPRQFQLPDDLCPEHPYPLRINPPDGVGVHAHPSNQRCSDLALSIPRRRIFWIIGRVVGKCCPGFGIGFVSAGRSCVIPAPDILNIGMFQQGALRPGQSRKQLRCALQQRSAIGGPAARRRASCFTLARGKNQCRRN